MKSETDFLYLVLFILRYCSSDTNPFAKYFLFRTPALFTHNIDFCVCQTSKIGSRETNDGVYT